MWVKPIQRIVISGCSGGGKSTLIDALRAQGEHVIEEPGRRIVQAELASSGSCLPWLDMDAFARRALALSRSDLDALPQSTARVFIDRGMIDAADALCRVSGASLADTLDDAPDFHPDVFFAPPWPEHFEQDQQRQSTWQEALEETRSLQSAYEGLGFAIVELPKISVLERVEFVLDRLEQD